MTVSTSKSDNWKAEYTVGGIPSSFRSEPSGSVADFVEFLVHRGIKSGKALDIGSGTGRNSIFLARSGFDVVSVDYVDTLVVNLNRIAEAEDLNIKAICHDIGTPWPVQTDSIDAAIDAFCFKHQIPEESVRLYANEIARVLRPGGHWMLSLAGKDDGYYRQFLDVSPDINRGVIVDPANNIASILYEKSEVLSTFPVFALDDYDHKIKSSLMHGREYRRSTHIFFFRKLS